MPAFLTTVLGFTTKIIGLLLIPGNMGMILFAVFIGMSAFDNPPVSQVGSVPVAQLESGGATSQQTHEVIQNTRDVKDNQKVVGVIGCALLILQIIKMGMDQRGKQIDHRNRMEERRLDQEQRELIKQQVETVEKKTDVQTALVGTVAREVANGRRGEVETYLEMYDQLGRRSEVRDERDRMEGKQAREQRADEAGEPRKPG